MFQLDRIQTLLQAYQLDGWLLYDFRRSNALCCRILDISEKQLLTRRFFYWIPSNGSPVKMISAVENPLVHLPGKEAVFHSWQELITILRTLFSEKQVIAMEYSPQGAIPEISRVDAGTIELVRQLGIKIVSSGDVLQELMCVWNEKQWQSHQKAAHVLESVVEETWDWLARRLANHISINEYDVQQHMLEGIEAGGCISAHPPICAINAHTSNPHFDPNPQNCWTIQRGDWILLDLWCKENIAEGVYADITRVGVAAERVSERQQQIFNLVKQAQRSGFEFIEQRYRLQQVTFGYEVDRVVRQMIEQAGFADYFIHRTGHNIDQNDHGPGAHLDDLETHDERRLLAGTCFSIEPGLYLPNEFGVRLEYDVFLHPNGQALITGGEQSSIRLLI